MASPDVISRHNCYEDFNGPGIYAEGNAIKTFFIFRTPLGRWTLKAEADNQFLTLRQPE